MRPTTAPCEASPTPTKTRESDPRGPTTVSTGRPCGSNDSIRTGSSTGGRRTSATAETPSRRRLSNAVGTSSGVLRWPKTAQAKTNTILVVGSVALDSLETPAGHREECLGGSASYFSVGASLFTQTQVVAVVAQDDGGRARQEGGHGASRRGQGGRHLAGRAGGGVGEDEHHEGVAVALDAEPWQVVPLAVDEAAGGGLRVEESHASQHRGADPCRPPRRVEPVEQFARHEAERDLRRGAPEGGAERAALRVVDANRAGRAVGGRDEIGAEDPRVPTLPAAAPPGRDDGGRHAAS